MADDIDDLLDEVETKYCAKGKAKLDSQKKISSSKQVNRSNLDAAIDDILNADEDFPQLGRLQLENKTPNTSHNSRPDSSRKCFPVYLGGATCCQGLSSTVNKRSCNNLRCTSCDFRVSQFENFEWDKATDYLFLRNNVPDFEKLKPKLKTRKGVRAYCCQCSWKSVKEMQVLDSELKWVCGRH